MSFFFKLLLLDIFIHLVIQRLDVSVSVENCCLMNICYNLSFFLIYKILSFSLNRKTYILPIKGITSAWLTNQYQKTRPFHSTIFNNNKTINQTKVDMFRSKTVCRCLMAKNPPKLERMGLWDVKHFFIAAKARISH